MTQLTTHIPSGHVVEIQDTMTDRRGYTRHYCEDHQRPTIAGWYPASHLRFAVTGTREEWQQVENLADAGYISGEDWTRYVRGVNALRAR